MTDTPSEEWIAISRVKENLNQAKIAFNLCSTPLFIGGPFRIIYDFEDLTTPNKQNLSSLRFDSYKHNHWRVEARP